MTHVIDFFRYNFVISLIFTGFTKNFSKSTKRAPKLLKQFTSNIILSIK